MRKFATKMAKKACKKVHWLEKVEVVTNKGVIMRRETRETNIWDLHGPSGQGPQMEMVCQGPQMGH